MDQQLFTEKHSKALKSSCRKGFECEEVVIKQFVSEGYVLLYQRLKTPFAEVDLIFKKAKDHHVKFLAVEVKSLSIELDIFPRIQRRQIQRLRRAHRYLSEELDSCVEFLVIFVGSAEVICVNLIDF